MTRRCDRDEILSNVTRGDVAGAGRRRGAFLAVGLVLMLAGLGACSVDPRWPEYRCSRTGLCAVGVCQDGWCVPGASAVDAAPAPTPTCPAVCTSCALDGTCNIQCGEAGACAARIVCPAGRSCNVDCSGDQSCFAGVSCDMATGCDVSCEGAGACSGGIACGEGPCSVECQGLGACAMGIECGQSCACDTACDNGALCSGTCPDRAAACERATGECDSSGVCNVC